MITKELIKSIRAASALATKGEWISDDDINGNPCVYGPQMLYDDEPDSPIIANCNAFYDMSKNEKIANAEFIALVRNHIDDILDRVEELEEQDKAQFNERIKLQSRINQLEEDHFHCDSLADENKALEAENAELKDDHIADNEKFEAGRKYLAVLEAENARLKKALISLNERLDEYWNDANNSRKEVAVCNAQIESKAALSKLKENKDERS